MCDFKLSFRFLKLARAQTHLVKHVLEGLAREVLDDGLEEILVEHVALDV